MYIYRYRVQIVIRCVLFFAILGTGPAKAQRLPSESSLPGAPRPATLPSESELPAKTPSFAPLLSPPPPGNETGRELPDEATLPPSVVAQAPQDPTIPGRPGSETPTRTGKGGANQPKSPLQLERSLDNTPWLRLQMPGSVGQIRTLAFTSDGSRLCAAGDDKSIVIWRNADPGGWFQERTVRWQVQRGPRGRIHALASAPGLIAIGGLGAMGESGEILLIDPANGALVTPLNAPQRGHRERITSLAFSPDPRQAVLASMDMAGRLIAWARNPGTGLWNPTTLDFDKKRAESLRPWRMLHPITMFGPNQVIAPFYAGSDSDGRVRWQLRRYDVRSGEASPLNLQNDYHYFFVSALAASPDAGLLASADDAGRLFLWPLSARQPTLTRKMDAAVTALQFNGPGTRLLLGTHATSTRPGKIRLLDTTDPKKTRDLWSESVNLPVLACAISPDGSQFAYAQGGTVVVGSLDKPIRAQRLRSPLRPPLRVAFRRGQPRYDIAMGTHVGPDGNVPFEHIFATGDPQLNSPRRIDDSQWNDPEAFRGQWNVVTQQAIDSFQVYLTRGARPQAVLPLRLDVHGAPSAICWISDASAKAARAVAIATNGTNNIYVFDLAENGEFRLLRQFRGHEGAVTSIGVSSDRRYLVSGGLDGTIRIWKLADLDKDLEIIQRWGADFQARNGELVTARIRPDGPLFFRGLRDGDVVSSLRLPDAVEGDVRITTVHDVGNMRNRLLQRPWDRLVAFDYRRGRQAHPSFQMYPAWQPVASLFVAENREWAYWTPSGYYDASFEGDKLFGWQVNRGLQRLPDFFLAAQVRQTLERPDIMARLLEQGSLDNAFKAAQQQAPANWSRVLIKQQQLKPDIRIVSPRPDDVVEGESLPITVTIDVPAGEKLIPPKAFVNGVFAGQAKLVKRSASPRGEVYQYDWLARVPSDPRLLVQVMAATEQEVVGRAKVFVNHQSKSPQRRRQLYIVSVGVNDYQDGRLTRLEYAVDNAKAVATTLAGQSRQLYSTRAVSLLDRNVTRPMWKLTVDQFAAEMSESVHPDDLLIIYLSGHGLRDVIDDGYYYVTADADLGDLLTGQFGDCLSFSDFAETFSEIPCRKLVILDTCHSGAVQPLSQRQLKAGLRALQNDLMFTLSATEGGQEAVEDREKRLGRFTFHLLNGLRGAADGMAGSRDKQVSLDELIRYVKMTVTAESTSDSSGQPQFPTAGPLELLQHVHVPLTGQNGNNASY